MIISKEKKKENIAEYLLYMWHVEDVIRANDLDIEKISESIISNYAVCEELKTETREWYESLIEMMRLENVIEKGHLQINKNIIIRLTDIHEELLKSPKYPEYSAEFYKTLPYIVELRAKSGEAKVGEIETCFNAMYGMLMLRLQNKDISVDTLMALTQISHFVATLARFFQKNEEEPLFEEPKN